MRTTSAEDFPPSVSDLRSLLFITPDFSLTLQPSSILRPRLWVWLTSSLGSPSIPRMVPRSALGQSVTGIVSDLAHDPVSANEHTL